MKKRYTCICFVLWMLIVMLPIQAGAAGILPEIEEQPQNLVYPIGSVAVYSVKTTGPVDSCTWFLEYGDETYDLSKANGTEPWSAFVTGSSGPSQDGNTYSYFFEGIEEGLAGAHIYAVLKKGNAELSTRKAMIQLGGTAMPPSIHVPEKAEITIGGELGLLCVASAPNGGLLTYTWYETSTGKLQDIIAIDRGDAKEPTLYVDTSEAGTRYYVCMVETEQEGVGYSSVIQVNVLEDSAMGIPVIFTVDSQRKVGSTMTVDLEAMADLDARIYEAFLEKTAQYQWYQEGVEIPGATQAAYTFTEGDAGHTFFVEVICGDLHIRSVDLLISDGNSGETQSPEATLVPTTSPVDPTPKGEGGFPWWIIPLLLGAMAVGAVIAFLVTRKIMKK